MCLSDLYVVPHGTQFDMRKGGSVVEKPILEGHEVLVVSDVIRKRNLLHRAIDARIDLLDDQGPFSYLRVPLELLL